MEAKLLHFLASKPASPPNLAVLTKPASAGRNHIFTPTTRPRPLRISPVYNTTSSSSSSSNSNGGSSSSSSSPDTDSNSVPSPPSTETAGIRFKRRSRRQAKQKREDDGRVMKAKADAAAAPKKWEEMSVMEKALELYVGEKGLLFWINKFAYASIYIVIGAWILFRFVGPALNLYQLDAPPLSPTSILKGS